MNEKILPILNYVFFNNKLPEITDDNSDMIEKLKDNHCLYRTIATKKALAANPYDKSTKHKQEIWSVDEKMVYEKYGLTSDDIVKG